MGVSKDRGTPKSSILIGFSIINHPFGGTMIFGGPPICKRYQERLGSKPHLLFPLFTKVPIPRSEKFELLEGWKHPSFQQFEGYTNPKTNSKFAPKNGWVSKFGSSPNFQGVIFQVRTVSFREGIV